MASYQIVLWYCCEFSFLFLLALIWNITMFFFRQVCWLGWCGAGETWEDIWDVIVKCAEICVSGRKSSYTDTERISFWSKWLFIQSTTTSRTLFSEQWNHHIFFCQPPQSQILVCFRVIVYCLINVSFILQMLTISYMTTLLLSVFSCSKEICAKK